MKKSVFRSLVFDALLIVLVGIECVVFLPCLLLPRRYFMAVVYSFVHTVYFLERVILNLHFEVRGLEHLPKDGAFIIAAKHQSQYETFKLHILFKDPAVILKRELLRIPLWGLYLKKSDVIAIDRSSPETAIASIQDGARRMAAQGRPIVIFPQGTRVAPHDTPTHKPYKIGIARIQEATGLPIIPLALNTGAFWPRGSFFKSSGTVVFKFLEPIPAGLERKDLLKTLEERIESESTALMAESQKNQNQGGKIRLYVLLAFLSFLLFGAYSALWFKTAERLRARYPQILHDFVSMPQDIAIPTITGYPFPIRMSVPAQTLRTPEGTLKITNFHATGWPFPFLPVDIETGGIEVQSIKWKSPLIFNKFSARVTLKDKILTIQDSRLTKGDFSAHAAGTVDLKPQTGLPAPDLPDLIVTLTNHQAFLETLAQEGMMEPRMALFIGAGLTALADKDGLVTLPLTQKNGTLYAGPLAITNW